MFKEPSWTNKLREFLIVSLIFFGITLVYFYPSLRSFSTSLIGPPEDNMQFFWFLWHGSESITRPHHLMHFIKTSYMYYPHGVNLLYANYYYYGIALSLILRFFLNMVQIYNFFILHSFVLSGIGAYYLIRYLGLGKSESVVGGFIFAFNPSHYAHALHHITIGSIHWVPFFVLFFLKAIKEDRKRNSVLAALFLILSSLCDWNYLVFGIVFIILSYVYLAIRQKRFWLKVSFVKMALILFLTVLTLSPLLVPMVLLGMGHSFKMGLPGHNIYVADIAGFIIPHPYHGLSDLSWIKNANALMTGTDWEKTAYLGAVNVVVLFLTFKALAKNYFKYFIGLFAFMILAMGVMPHFFGKALPIPMPYMLLEKLPFFTNARSPSRMMVFVYLFLSILVAFSLRELFLKGKFGNKAKLGFFLVSLFIFLDFFSVCRAATPVELPGAYGVIRADKDKDFGILEIPHEYGRHLMYQVTHQIPIVQGYIGRRVDDALGDTLEFNLDKLERQKKTLIENKVKYIVIFKKKITWRPAAPEDQVRLKYLEYAAQKYASTYQKLYEDDAYAVFKVYS